VRAAHYELTRLLREAADRGQGVDRRALTDDEWLAVFRSSGSADQAARAERVLARCAEVKYAGRDATKWAVDETIGEARELLLALEASARSAGDGAAPGGRP
jgi:hypothetical protein